MASGRGSRLVYRSPDLSLKEVFTAAAAIPDGRTYRVDDVESEDGLVTGPAHFGKDIVWLTVGKYAQKYTTYGTLLAIREIQPSLPSEDLRYRWRFIYPNIRLSTSRQSRVKQPESLLNAGVLDA